MHSNIEIENLDNRFIQCIGITCKSVSFITLARQALFLSTASRTDSAVAIPNQHSLGNEWSEGCRKGRSVPLDGSVCFWQRRWWSSHSDGSVCFPLHHFSKYKYMSKLDSKHANNQVERNQRKNFDLWMLMSTSSWIATQISGLILMTSYNMKHNHPERINEHIIMRQRK